jgi:hypothetical protein
MQSKAHNYFECLQLAEGSLFVQPQRMSGFRPSLRLQISKKQ